MPGQECRLGEFVFYRLPILVGLGCLMRAFVVHGLHPIKFTSAEIHHL